MATKILHIGDDVCRRIPVMQTAGFAVFRCEVDIPAIRIAFDREEDYSAVIFHNDISAVPEDAVRESRSLSEAPLVLFQNPTVACENGEFDLVIPAHTPPDIWLQKMREVIQTFRETCERSRQVRKDCAASRFKSQSLRLESSRNRTSPINPDAPRRGREGDGPSEAKPPEEARPEKFGEKAG